MVMHILYSYITPSSTTPHILTLVLHVLTDNYKVNGFHPTTLLCLHSLTMLLLSVFMNIMNETTYSTYFIHAGHVHTVTVHLAILGFKSLLPMVTNLVQPPQFQFKNFTWENFAEKRQKVTKKEMITQNKTN